MVTWSRVLCPAKLHQAPQIYLDPKILPWSHLGVFLLEDSDFRVRTVNCEAAGPKT